MRVYFSTCGIGMGHTGRCLEVAKSLRDKGVEIIFSTYSDGIPLVSHEGFKYVVAPRFAWWTWPDGAVDPWRTLKWMSGKLLGILVRQVAFEVKQIAAFHPDVVVSDSRISTGIASIFTGHHTVTLLNQFHIVAPGFFHYRVLPTLSDIFSFTFLSPVWGFSKRVLIPDYPPPYTISDINIRIPKVFQHKISYTGPILPVKVEALPSRDEIKKRMGFDDRPLIYAAASGPRQEKIWLGEKMLRYLSDFSEKYQVALSLGLNDMPQEQVSRRDFKVYGWVPDRFETLKACDLVIGRGSHATVTQALAFGKPMILIPTQEQTEQIGNAKTAERLGVAKIVDQRTMSRELLLSKVEEMLNSSSYQRRAERFMEVAAKMNALETLVNMILSKGGT